MASILGAFAGLFAAGAELEVFSWRSIFWSFGSLSLVLLAVPLLVPESLASERINLDPMCSAIAVLGVGRRDTALHARPTQPARRTPLRPAASVRAAALRNTLSSGIRRA